MNVIGLFLYEVKFFFAAGINTTWSKHKLWHYISGAQTSLIVNGLSCSVGRWNERIYRITDGRLWDRIIYRHHSRVRWRDPPLTLIRELTFVGSLFKWIRGRRKILKGVSHVTSATFCLSHVGKWICCTTSKQNDSYARWIANCIELSVQVKFSVRLIGDVSLIKLGMSEEEFVHLSSEVCVLNCLFSQSHFMFLLPKRPIWKKKRRHCLKLFCSDDIESPLNKFQN